jgi:DNA-binding Lrp family transcriptional regulator
MKDIELKLITELMRNGRRSDRELAKAIGASQPTVTRVRSRLEKEGIIKEYAMIPDFTKLGFEIMAVTFLKFKEEPSAERLKKIREYSKEIEKKKSGAILMAMNGIGLRYDRVFISFHENYASYLKAVDEVRRIPYFEPSQLDSFMINLLDESHFQTLTLSVIANYLLKTAEEEKP